ncbi:MAG: hypothetical protein R6V54_08640 [Desulfobacteraceae bacterium]
MGFSLLGERFSRVQWIAVCFALAGPAALPLPVVHGSRRDHQPALLWFASSAKRLNLSTIGILQYLGPSIAFVLGVFVCFFGKKTGKPLWFWLVQVRMGVVYCGDLI